MHRIWSLLVAIGLAAAGWAAVADLRTYKRGSDWPTFQGPALDGSSEERGLDLDWSDGEPPLRFSVELGEGYGGPSISRGRLFLFDRVGGEARLRALNAETGDELWDRRYPTDYEDMYGFSDGPRTTPVVDGDRVYTFGVEGKLRCHRVEDGALVWEVDTAERYNVVQNFFGVGSTPLIEGGLLIVPVGGSPEGSPGVRSGEVVGNGSGLVAFDKRTGKERWRATDELASYSSPIAVDWRGGRLGLAFLRGGLVGFRPQSGKVEFTFPWRARKIESVNAANPVIVGGAVLISESYGPGAALLRPKAGDVEVVWKDPPRPKSLATHWMTPVHLDGVLYGCSGSGSGDAELRAVSASDGKVLWSRKGLGRTTLLRVDGHLVVLGERGTLTVVAPDPAGYTEVARFTPRGEDGSPLIGYPAWTPPVLAQGRLYVRGKDRLACFDLRPGKIDTPRAKGSSLIRNLWPLCS